MIFDVERKYINPKIDRETKKIFNAYIKNATNTSINMKTDLYNILAAVGSVIKFIDIGEVYLPEPRYVDTAFLEQILTGAKKVF